MIKFSVYGDGSSGGNSIGPIGWGWVVVKNDTEILCAGSDGYEIGTNNVAELMAAREGLRALVQHPEFQAAQAGTAMWRVELVSDSQYVLGLANGSYSATKNTALADHLREICRLLYVQTRWVKGHAGDPLNEMCDKLAKIGKEQFMKNGPNKRSRRRARRKKR